MLRKGMIWMPMDKKDQLAELISNAETSFYNGQLQEAFSLSLSAIKLDENCADAYQYAANVCMSLSRYEHIKAPGRAPIMLRYIAEMLSEITNHVMGKAFGQLIRCCRLRRIHRSMVPMCSGMREIAAFWAVRMFI